MSEQDKRREAFRALMESYQADAYDYDQGQEEDPRPYLDGTEPISRYVCVTLNYSRHGYGKFFFLIFEERDAAELRAVEFATDDIFEELPVEIRDLDTGESWAARWSSLQWRKLNRKL